MALFLTVKKNLHAIAGLLLLLIISLIFLFIPPIGGVADNGSFFSILKSVGLYNLFSSSSDFVNINYGITATAKPVIDSSHTLLIALCAKISLAFGSDLFNLRILSFIYLLILSIAVFLCTSAAQFSRRWLNWVTTFLVVFIACDLSYLLYLNSLYPAALTSVSLMLSICAFFYAIGQKNRLWSIMLFYAGALLFATSSPLCLIPGIFIALASLAFLPTFAKAYQRIICLVLCAVVIASGLFVYGGKNQDTYKKDIYSSVFGGILYGEEDPTIPLHSLGLDAENLSSFASVPYYQVATNPAALAILDNAFYQKISFGKIGMFYLTNPAYFSKALAETFEASFVVPIEYLGNFDSSKGVKTNITGLWNSLKLKVLLKTGAYGLWHMLFFIIAGIYAYIKGSPLVRRGTAMYAAMLLSAIWMFISAFPTWGRAELEQHLLIFNYLFDLIFSLTIIWGLYTLMARRSELKHKFGVTQ